MNRLSPEEAFAAAVEEWLHTEAAPAYDALKADPSRAIQVEESVRDDLSDDLDNRLLVKERVVGLSDGSSSVAVVRSSLVGRDPLEVTVGSRRLVVRHRPGQASALDADTVAGGADVGTVGVFIPVLDDERLHFDADSAGSVDRETGSSWNVLGRATAGPLKGGELEPYHHLDIFWFAWASFHHDTDVVGSPGQDGAP